jgi:YVTN family beta-propeller protein
MRDLPTGTITFLFTDIEGSTRLLKHLGEGYAEVLQQHQRLLRDAFEQAGGEEIDTQGDAFFVAFRRARDAVAAAFAAQLALAAHHWPNGEPVRVRMGLHTSEPVVGGERYVGLGVHRAARICSAGHGGQILLSGATRELVEDDLPTGTWLRDLGHHRLKDIDRPEHIFELVGDGLATDFPELRTVATQPDEATPFSGREGELAAAVGGTMEGRSWGRRRLLGFVLALLLAGGAVVGILVARGGSPSVTVIPNSVAVIDPAANRIVDDVSLPGDSPGPIGIGADGLWALSVNSKTLSNIDPKTREVLSTQGIGGTPTSMAVAGREVWVLDSCGATVNPKLFRYEHGLPENFDPVMLPTKTVSAKTSTIVACGLAASGESAWAGLNAPLSVVHVSVDPASNIPNADEPIEVPGNPNAIALGTRVVWVAEYSANLVRRIDPATRRIAATVPVGSGPIAVVATPDAVWVANKNDGSVSRIDPPTNSVVKAISVGDSPHALAVGAGAVWVANADDGTVSRIDPLTNTVSSTISLGHRPQGIVVANGLVWVTVRA